jgi:hypothetical protein
MEEKRGLKDEEGTPADNAETQVAAKIDSKSGIAVPDTTSIAADQTQNRTVVPPQD